MQAYSLQQRQSNKLSESVWNWCEPLISKCIQYQDMYNISDVRELIETGRFQLFPHHNQQSCFVTELVVYPQSTALNLIFCAGRFKDLEEMLPSIENFARHFGATKLYGGGRKGWAKKAQHLGFHAENIISKEI